MILFTDVFRGIKTHLITGEQEDTAVQKTEGGAGIGSFIRRCGIGTGFRFSASALKCFLFLCRMFCHVCCEDH